MVTDFLIVFLSIIYGAIVLGIFQHLIFKEQKKSVYWIYLLYVVLSILYLNLNIEIVPDFKGFTGGFRIGTDDCRFFLQVVDVKFSLPVFCHSLTEMHSFSKWLNFLYPFEVRYPIQIVPFNCIGISLIPFIGKSIFSYYFPNEGKKSEFLFLILILSPTILQNGIILMRDGWTTQLFLVFVYGFLIRKNIFIMVISAMILAALRPGFVIFPILFYVVEKYSQTKFFVLKSILLLGIGFPIFSYILKLNYGVDLAGGLVRDEFVEGFLGRFGEESILFRIMSLPFPLNTILSFVFFFTSPFIKFQFFNDGVFVSRTVFVLFEALLSTFLLPIFIKNFYFIQKEDKQFKKILIFVSLSILLLCTISLQARHKLIVLPFIYIMFVKAYKKDKSNALFIFGYLTFQLLI